METIKKIIILHVIEEMTFNKTDSKKMIHVTDREKSG